MKLFLFFFIFLSGLCYSQPSDFEHINFKMADSIALKYKGESLHNLPVLTHNLTAHLPTDVEKFRAIYTWVSTNIENDYHSYVTTSNKRKKIVKDKAAFLAWNKDFTPKMFEKLIQQRKTACTGYAYLVREMAYLAEIECKIIDGYGRTANTNLTTKSEANHSWNLVKLNNKWYLSDATWSAGKTILEENGPIFTFDYKDGYFLADPELFIKNHFPLQSEWSLLADTITFEDFLEGPIIYNDAFEYQIIPSNPLKMKIDVLRDEPINFHFKIPNKIYSNRITITLNKNSIAEKGLVKPTKNTDEYSLQYKFSKTGLYDVHIRVDSTSIATYVVKVNRK